MCSYDQSINFDRLWAQLNASTVQQERSKEKKFQGKNTDVRRDSELEPHARTHETNSKNRSYEEAVNSSRTNDDGKCREDTHQTDR